MLIMAGILIVTLLIGSGMNLLLQQVLQLPRGQQIRAIRSLPGKKRLTDRISAKIIDPIGHILAKALPISDYREKQLQADLDRIDSGRSAKEWISNQLARSLVLALLGLLFIPIGIPWLSLLTVVTSVIAYFRAMQDLRHKVEKTNRRIEAELPRLVESLIYSLQDNRDLISFFENYRKVAGMSLGKELDKLILQMKIGNHELALRQFEARLAIPQLSALVSILCGVHQGVDQKTSLLILEQDIRTKQRETMRREMEKRPGRIKAASFILTVLMILMFMVPLVLMILSNLKTAGF